MVAPNLAEQKGTFRVARAGDAHMRAVPAIRRPSRGIFVEAATIVVSDFDCFGGCSRHCRRHCGRRQSKDCGDDESDFHRSGAPDLVPASFVTHYGTVRVIQAGESSRVGELDRPSLNYVKNETY